MDSKMAGAVEGRSMRNAHGTANILLKQDGVGARNGVSMTRMIVSQTTSNRSLVGRWLQLVNTHTHTHQKKTKKKGKGEKK